jgi:hypothetical protein
MKFFLDAMLPPQAAVRLSAHGHDVVTPFGLRKPALSDAAIVEIATAERRVVVTENVDDFAHVTTCTVLFVKRSWWARQPLVVRLADALDRWAATNPDPGPWPRWLDAKFH